MGWGALHLRENVMLNVVLVGCGVGGCGVGVWGAVRGVRGCGVVWTGGGRTRPRHLCT